MSTEPTVSQSLLSAAISMTELLLSLHNVFKTIHICAFSAAKLLAE